MSIKESVQLHILDSIKQKLKPNISLVDELAELLEISKDSAYRRIRGEKSLDIKEIQILAKYYNLSLDSILNADTNVLSFHTQVIGAQGFSFKDYLISILERLRMISQMDDKVISYSARDLPIFHNFMFPELAAFKIFFWRKTYLNEPQLVDARFDLDTLPDRSRRTTSYLSRDMEVLCADPLRRDVVYRNHNYSIKTNTILSRNWDF